MQIIIVSVIAAFLLASCDKGGDRSHAAIYSQNDPTAIACSNRVDSLPEFADLIKNLQKAAAEKDVDYIKQLADDHIKFSFGPEGADKAGFLQEWKLDAEPDTSPFWAELKEMLRLGGYSTSPASEKMAVFPCTFQELPKYNWLLKQYPDISSFDYQIVVRNDTFIEDYEGKPIRKLVFGETVFAQNPGSLSFITYDGIKGNIPTDALRSPISYRMVIQRVDGIWKMTVFIAGD